MPDKKYQIFISSTFADLKDERQAAMNAVITLRHIPIGMEGFPAIDQEQMSYIRRLIDECDYYVLLVANRYGSKDPSGISYTELEYQYAVRQGKHVLAFLNNQQDPTLSDDPAALARFKEAVSTGRIIKHFENRNSLELAVSRSLAEAFEADPREGWVRASSAIDPSTLKELADARTTIARLQQEISRSAPAPIANLAGLEDSVTLSFRGRVRHDDYVRDHSIETTWRHLFLALADCFRVGHGYAAGDHALREFVHAVRGRYYEIMFTTTERIRILNQFELMGLMVSQVATSTDGNLGVFYTLTKRGDTIRLTGKAVLKT